MHDPDGGAEIGVVGRLWRRVEGDQPTVGGPARYLLNPDPEGELSLVGAVGRDLRYVFSDLVNEVKSNAVAGW